MNLFSRVILPLLLLIYISIETYLKLNHTSLCEATGCKLAGELLRFNPLYLNYVGIASVFTLVILGYLSLKSKAIEKLFFVALYSAIAFEATILGYQFLVNPEPCIFCMGIFSSLLIIALLSRMKNFIFIVAAALSVFIGLNTLALNKNKSFLTHEGTYLLHSETCPHCKKVKKYLAEHHIQYTPISIKEASVRNFLKFAGFTTIPVLVLKDAQGTRMLEGDHKIISHYEHEDHAHTSEVAPKEQPAQSNSAIGLPADLFKATSEPGCAITITETPDCEKNATAK